MKRYFESPEMELLKFAVADVITVSCDDCDLDGLESSAGTGNCY